MKPKILLIGSTDLTLKSAEFLYENKILSGVINTQPIIKNASGHTQKNERYQDLEKWCEIKKIYFRRLTNQEDISQGQKDTGSEVALLIGVHSIVKKSILDIFSQGAYAVHASLLPSLRGWSPLSWAILLGLEATGVSLFKIGSGMDDGPIVYQKKIDLNADIYIENLIMKAQQETTEILRLFVNDFNNNNIRCFDQNLNLSSFVLQRQEEDSRINWVESAEKIYRLVRASGKPYFGAFCFINDKKMRVFKVKPSSMQINGRPGQIFRFSKDMPLHVCCGSGSIILESVEIEGQSDALSYLSQNINETIN